VPGSYTTTEFLFTLFSKDTISDDWSSLKTSVKPLGEISLNGGENKAAGSMVPFTDRY